MKHILLIDDEAGIQELWQRFFEVLDKSFKGACRLNSASTLSEADRMMDGIKYDAVILDLFLPPGGIDESVKWLSEKSATVPVIVLTGSEEIELRQRCIFTGAAQFFTKADAIQFPNLFFKVVYNEWLKHAYAP